MSVLYRAGRVDKFLIFIIDGFTKNTGRLYRRPEIMHSGLIADE